MYNDRSFVVNHQQSKVYNMCLYLKALFNSDLKLWIGALKATILMLYTLSLWWGNEHFSNRIRNSNKKKNDETKIHLKVCFWKELWVITGLKSFPCKFKMICLNAEPLQVTAPVTIVRNKEQQKVKIMSVFTTINAAGPDYRLKTSQQQQKSKLQ